MLILGGGPTGICTLLCVMLKQPKRIILSEVDEARIKFLQQHYPDVLVVNPKETDVEQFVKEHSDHGGADRVLEVAGGKETFELAWKSARPNAIVTIVAMYEENQILPLPQIYGKNLIFKTGGVDGCDCDETLRLIRKGENSHHTADYAYFSVERDRKNLRDFPKIDGKCHKSCHKNLRMISYYYPYRKQDGYSGILQYVVL